MDHLIAALAPGSRVLDLGARTGSLETGRSDLCLVHLDLEIPARRGEGAYVAGDAARMPFAEHCFDLIVSNHSLEHVENLDGCLREISRVLKPAGILYVAVPDSTTRR